MPSARSRFALEAAFLIVVAAGAALARLSPQGIIGLMLVAWLLVALIERASSREHARALPEQPGEPLAREVEEPEPEVAPREGLGRLFRRRRPDVAEPLAAPTAALEERPSRAHVRRLEPEPPVVVEVEVELTEVIVVEEPAPRPAVTKRPLELPGLEEPEPKPEPKPEPEPEPEPEPVAAPAPVLEAPLSPPPPEPAPIPTAPPAAREWNLWELERRAREQAGEAARDEEWTALFVHLREFANADGVLPMEFDDLVRESFAELIQAA